MTQHHPAKNTRLDIFLVAPPGLEQALRGEALSAGFSAPKCVPGGVQFQGRWQEVWRANLTLRGATRVLVRIDQFPVTHLSQLDKRAHQVDWAAVLPRGIPVRVETTCRRSKIYHDRAASERIEKALVDVIGAQLPDRAEEAEITVKVRIEKDLCTISLDSSGESLHKRGHKTATGKAPMRETLASLFLREMGFDGNQPVLDPMCGSGTFVIEAAEWAAGLLPGRSRSFAFEKLTTFDFETYQKLKERPSRPLINFKVSPPQFFGSDRNAGAVENSRKNADSAGVAALTQFTHAAISDLTRPDCDPGIVIVNPPYGERIGDKKQLFALHGRLGQVLQERFSGWRVGLITSDGGLAKATKLPLLPPGPPVDHGGLRVKLYQTDPLP
ncbi:MULTISPECIES: class I SAM-dependent RNA methyltransferase [unclassified Aliiroseovarius]|uniref:THUMP domain-containing class I SAM-dependent RNA methyltransferase n=1 Tax=unclassified Aliiroseovarius TaxID=2623558 RepID=UPI001569FB62|nr:MULTISPECIES: THUMP domain-containing protein [unclassified Aliiroseovarius]NRP29649.1 Ribosomal RNA large subunit methyltransferase L [Aliiroseovarius sp. xm-m-314]NRP79291.1 Ribosomal RNA large subunit methyltransferase L [Aliiroseovarius sp. xm-v-209]NRQ10412.1 Ribosomal RNA large subunit methyltransferase L [Aliiroseovarius sp. xm-v-208]